jgi:hypothetical protein
MEKSKGLTLTFMLLKKHDKMTVIHYFCIVFEKEK